MRIASDVASVTVRCGELNNCVARRINKVVARLPNSNTATGSNAHSIPASRNALNSNRRGADLVDYTQRRRRRAQFAGQKRGQHRRRYLMAGI
ncbi:hypothetical protein ABH37_10575 [Mycobacterium haemophilum]|uniref:Uncharacterized protein n=1 Tax=Mycobacterium haemophilum TaxID=29311 RepID=A0A0I9ZQE1_9MYCO|nr:hypothetical protein ABH38_11945 [Mycobacterium haemophilum]KLO42596.1 hypothetical protein ABH37_10575 [Mycobacterium haemophilum]KLO55472.1 hypothetical protein ABH36_07550 [Mycobacterium haemophilum]